MRLINTKTLRQTEFYGSRLSDIRYAILSHCWGEDEVTFEEFMAESHRTGPGWQKIVDCCALARTQGLEWAWVDTCCIDKRSSAELSEAINSMFKWYQQAAVCYVFLHDLDASSLVVGDASSAVRAFGSKAEGENGSADANTRSESQEVPTQSRLGDSIEMKSTVAQIQATDETTPLSLPVPPTSSSGSAGIQDARGSSLVSSVDENDRTVREPTPRFANIGPNLLMPKIQACRWWTRGWTLQELLAPSHIIFYDKNLECLGSKTSLVNIISIISKIEAEYLLSSATIPEACIAQRMSWASTRETTREEDLAYCLLGLFNINMPLLYGEGMAAFTRLQHAIIAQSNDQSIFAWTSDSEELLSVLAQSPSNFANSGNIRQIRNPSLQSTHRITNAGLELDASGTDPLDAKGFLVLECFRQCPWNSWQLQVAIYFERVAIDFERVMAASFRADAKNLPTEPRRLLIGRTFFSVRKRHYYFGLGSPQLASKQHVPWHRRYARSQLVILPPILGLGLSIIAVVLPEFKVITYWTAALIVWIVATNLEELFGWTHDAFMFFSACFTLSLLSAEVVRYSIIEGQ